MLNEEEPFYLRFSKLGWEFLRNASNLKLPNIPVRLNLALEVTDYA